MAAEGISKQKVISVGLSLSVALFVINYGSGNYWKEHISIDIYYWLWFFWLFMIHLAAGVSNKIKLLVWAVRISTAFADGYFFIEIFDTPWDWTWSTWVGFTISLILIFKPNKRP